MTETAPREGSRVKRVGWFVAKLAVTVGALVYVFSKVGLAELRDAFARLSWVAFAAAVVLSALNVLVATVRWRCMLVAYGAPHPPAFTRLAKLNFVGLFYNTFLPGAVGGDVVRALASLEAFGGGSIAASMTVVFIERVLGLTGLLLLAAGVFLVHPMSHVEGIYLWGAVGVTGAVGTVAAVALGRRIARFLPGPLGRIAATLPAIQSPLYFAIGILLSVVTQTGVALTGHVIVSSLDGRASWLDSFVLVPVASAAAYFPLTVGGAGAREAAFVSLYQTIGVARASALAASLSMWASQGVVAAFGGLLSLMSPITQTSIPVSTTEPASRDDSLAERPAASRVDSP